MATKRKCKTFWISVKGTVCKAVGHECPNDPGYWYFPQVGMSLKEGFSAFNLEAEAKVVARDYLIKEITRLQTLLKLV